MVGKKVIQLLILMVAAAVLFSSSTAAEAGRKVKTAPAQPWYQRDKTTMIEGHIEEVTSGAIRVDGKYYDFTGVPIRNQMGQTSSQSQLVRGREVKLFFQDGALNVIMVFESRLIQ
ncbi:MAG: hypothetical protein M0Z61_02100 [Nitrospiraceae bacterium]|nr:hypothetical protein [Nitrospiraceae bacterium]